MPFTLIFLGTDTTYSATDDHLGLALRGLEIRAQQTLSGVAGYIEPSVIETDPILYSQALPVMSDVHVLNNQVVVIDGPDTTGQVVHDKIGKGLVVILDAIIRGETDISIIGFSRGAVELLIAMHELQRMQEALQSRAGVLMASDMWAIISNTVAPWCRNHLRDYHKDRITPLLHAEVIDTVRRWFCDNPEAIALHGFAVDPVPGLADGSRMNPIAWVDARHHYVPKIVTRLDVVYQEDERTVGFVPIWIDNILPTNVVNTRTELRHYHLPGFHGTPDGNLFDHCLSGAATALIEPQTRDVQTVVFYLILDFLEATGVTLIAPPERNRFYLDTLYSPFKRAHPIDRERLYFTCYQNMHKNIDAYRVLRSKHYQYLSVEDIDKERKVKTSVKGVKTLSECFNGIKIVERPEAFINAHHFLLAFNRVRIPEALPHNLSDHQQLCLRMSHFLEQFIDHNPDTDLNKLVKHVDKDRYKIVTDVIQSAPKRLARYYYSAHVPSEDCQQLIGSIERLLTLSLDADDAEIVAKKREFLQQFQQNMQIAMVTEARQLLTMMSAWIDRYWARSNLHHAQSGQAVPGPFTYEDERVFMQQAEEYYVLLSRCTQQWPRSAVVPDLCMALHQQFVLFPLLCERVLTQLGWQDSDLKESGLGEKIIGYHHAHMGVNAPHLVALSEHLATLRVQVQSMGDTLRATINERNGALIEVERLRDNLEIQRGELTRREVAQNYLTNSLKQECQGCLSGLSWQIIGGFIAVLGVASVALALISLGSSSMLLVGSGIVIGGLLSSVGFYSVRKGAQIERDNHLLAKYNVENVRMAGVV